MPENVVAEDRRSSESRRATIVPAEDDKRAQSDRRQGDDRRGHSVDLMVADDAAVPDIIKWLTKHAVYKWTIGSNSHNCHRANCGIRFFDELQLKAFTAWVNEY